MCFFLIFRHHWPGLIMIILRSQHTRLAFLSFIISLLTWQARSIVSIINYAQNNTYVQLQAAVGTRQTWSEWALQTWTEQRLASARRAKVSSNHSPAFGEHTVHTRMIQNFHFLSHQIEKLKRLRKNQN